MASIAFPQLIKLQILKTTERARLANPPEIDNSQNNDAPIDKKELTWVFGGLLLKRRGGRTPNKHSTHQNQSPGFLGAFGNAVCAACCPNCDLQDNLGFLHVCPDKGGRE